MFQATRPTRPQYLDRKAATLAVLLLVVFATACRADGAARSGDVLLEPEDTVLDAVYQAARVYNDRQFNCSLESYPAAQRDLVFVIDASGSMGSLLPFVINETMQVVNELKPIHSITVICFSGRGIYEVDSVVGWSGPRVCKWAFKAEIRDWLTLSNHRFKTGGSGSRFAEAAIVRALRYKPELIFLLSDHLGGSGAGSARYGLDPDALLASIHAQNDVQNPARINTISFVNSGPLAEAGLRGTLERIADETGGRYKTIGKRDLNLR